MDKSKTSNKSVEFLGQVQYQGGACSFPSPTPAVKPNQNRSYRDSRDDSNRRSLNRSGGSNRSGEGNRSYQGNGNGGPSRSHLEPPRRDQGRRENYQRETQQRDQDHRVNSGQNWRQESPQSRGRDWRGRTRNRSASRGGRAGRSEIRGGRDRSPVRERSRDRRGKSQDPRSRRDQYRRFR